MQARPRGSTGTAESTGGARHDLGPAPPARRSRAFRPLVVAGLALLGALACGLMLRLDLGRPIAAGATPRAWPVQFHVTFLDAATGRPVPGVEVGEDFETGDFNHTGPAAWTAADPAGRWSGTMHIECNLRRANGSNGYEGLLVFSNHFFAVRAPGYREDQLWPEAQLGAPRWVKVAPNQAIVRNATILLRPVSPPRSAGGAP